MNPVKNHLTLSLLLVCGLALLAVPCASAGEKDAASSPAATARFRAMDADNDGRLSPAEFAAGNQQKLDSNNDGVISDEEKAAAKPAKKHWWSRSSDTPSQDPAAVTQQFTKLDANSDGFLSESEFAAGEK